MIIEVGRLVNNVEVKKVKQNDCEISVINNRLAIYQGKEHTVFIDVAFWGNIADFVGNNFKKGDEIYIEGELRQKQIKISENKIILGNSINAKSVKPTFGKAKENVNNEEK